MSRQTQNAVKLFMLLQNARSKFMPGDLPTVIEGSLDNTINYLNEVIKTREKRGE